jgi:signal transduction histidine kinase
MARSRIDDLWFAMAAGAFAVGLATWWQTAPVGALGGETAMLALWLAAGSIAACAWRRVSAPAAFDVPFMPAQALATSLPLSMVSVAGTSTSATALAMVASGLAVVPLAWTLASRLVSGRRRSHARGWLLLAAAGAVVLGVGVAAGDGLIVRAWRWLVVAVSIGVPAAMLALELVRGDRRALSPGPQPRIRALTVLAIGAIPILAGLSLATPAWPVLLVPTLAVAATVVMMGRYAVQPLAGLVSTATEQRDRIVAATEAERTRLASVLHDGPLADITLLVQRLDQRGDDEDAAIARSIASELRSIGSELRLPILDDLGTGPALEWLVERLVQRSGARVRLEQTTVARPPASVELATYRVAQEALVNALKHGAAPIVVQYRATPEGMALSVDDAGPGLEDGALERAEREGRLGLTSMVQRAEAIGARLVLSARPDGGSHVGLEWRPLEAP